MEWKYVKMLGAVALSTGLLFGCASNEEEDKPMEEQAPTNEQAPADETPMEQQDGNMENQDDNLGNSVEEGLNETEKNMQDAVDGEDMKKDEEQ